MKPRSLGVLIVFACLTLVTAAGAASVELDSVDFPERKTVDLTFTAKPGAPAAKMTGKVTYRDGQASIELSYNDMKPAILYGGDVTCYVLWAVTEDGNASNLGEVLAATPKGSQKYSSANRKFALMITTEPYYLVQQPSALVAFANDPLEKKKIASNAFIFSAFREQTPSRAMDSIQEIAWVSKTPLELLQARKAFAIAGTLEAEQHAPSFYAEASESLELANAQLDKSPGSKKLIDYARRSVALSNEAINISVHRIEGIELEREIAARRAEMADLESAAQAARQEAVAAQAEARSAQAEAEMAQSEAAEFAAETKRLAAEKAALRKETAIVTARLEEALGHVAQTKNTARGYVVSLPDILFALNEATLTPEARVVIAKLSGILLVMTDLQVQVEGYTDSTGSVGYNLELSQRRAESVKAFMGAEGIDPDRIKAVGFGMERPVADNATEQGRKKNRRVEIVLSDG